MPLIKYTARHPEGHELVETQLFPRGDGDPESIVKTYEPIFKTCKLVKVEILNPFVHSVHEWKRISRMGERIYYECAVCGCQAYNKFSNFKGEIKCWTREGKWNHFRFEHCKDPLKEMPMSTKLFR